MHSLMFNELSKEIAPDKWVAIKGKRIDNKPYETLSLLFDYLLTKRVRNPIEVLAEISNANYETVKSRLRYARLREKGLH